MKFSSTTEPRSHRPRRTAETLRSVLEDGEGLDVRRCISRQLFNDWQRELQELYEGKRSEKVQHNPPFYESAALMRIISKNVGMQWDPPQEWQPTLIKAAQDACKRIADDRESTRRTGRILSTEHHFSSAFIAATAVLALPEVRKHITVTDQVVEQVKWYVDFIWKNDFGFSSTSGIENTFALAVLRPDQRGMQWELSDIMGTTPKTLMDDILTNDATDNPEAYLAMLRLLYPNEQEHITQLWTEELRTRAENRFLSKGTPGRAQHSNLQKLKTAFGLLVMQAQDARLIDGEVVLEFAQPLITNADPLPSRQHL